MIALSGLSGAGKSTAAKALEDQGYFVVDNLPAELLSKFAELGSHGHEHRPLAFVIDSREAEHLEQFIQDWASLKQATLWFLEASDSTLVRRFQETRRPHPFDHADRGVLESIQAEREILSPLRAIANLVLCTDGLNPHELRAEIHRLLQAPKNALTHVRLMSFGFKHGLPEELDLCLDVRFLKNPYFEPTLKAHTGLEEPVRDYVLSAPQAQIFLEKTSDLLKFLIPCYASERKSYLTLAVGCTGGKHRSVAIVAELQRLLQQAGHSVQVFHRDIQK